MIEITYDYKCIECDNEFTIEKSMSDTSEVICSKCESLNVNRVYGVPIFKNNMSDCCGTFGGGR